MALRGENERTLLWSEEKEGRHSVEKEKSACRMRKSSCDSPAEKEEATFLSEKKEGSDGRVGESF